MTTSASSYVVHVYGPSINLSTDVQLAFAVNEETFDIYIGRSGHGKMTRGQDRNDFSGGWIYVPTRTIFFNSGLLKDVTDKDDVQRALEYALGINMRRLTGESLLREMPMISAAEAHGEGLALIITSVKKTSIEFVLYDPDALRSELSDEVITKAKREAAGYETSWKNLIKDSLPRAVHKFMRAGMRIDQSNNTKLRAADVWEVKASVADHGYGPLMYDIAMNTVGGLIPDRIDVSDEALAVWTHYFKHRRDVRHEYLAMTSTIYLIDCSITTTRA